MSMTQLNLRYFKICLNVFQNNFYFQLIKMHERMKKGKTLGDCDMDDLLAALRVFREQATMFSAEGSTDEINFQSRIGDLIELIRLLMEELNSIKATIEEYDEEGCNDGIAESLVKISDEMQKVGVLMQQVNNDNSSFLISDFSSMLLVVIISKRHWLSK